MKEHLSVLTLAARSSLYKVLGLLVMMGAAQAALFWFALQRAEAAPVGLEQLIIESRISIVFALCFFLLCGLLCLTGCQSGHGKSDYTLRRLSVREERLMLLWAGYNAVCFLLFWAAQVVIALLLCRLYTVQADPAYVSDQTVFLAFYRSSFLHSLLPLENVIIYIRNIVLVLCLGLCTSLFSFWQRRGQKGMAAIVLAVIVAVGFNPSMGSLTGNILLAAAALVVTAVAVAGARNEVEYES